MEKRRKAIPFEFVLDALTAAQPRTRPLFGCLAIYRGDKIVLALRNQGGGPDDGVWIASRREHHDSLRRQFPNIRPIALFGPKSSGWQVLPAEAPDFEESALRLCDLICARDPRIGRVPQRRS